MPMSSKDRRILSVAIRETDPANVHRFAPITRGFFIAVLGILTIGVLSAVYCLGMVVFKPFKKWVGSIERG